MRIAVVGVTGLVGQVMLKVLKERNFPITELIPIASKKSAGKEIKFNDETYKVITVEDALSQEKIDMAIFSAGASVSKQWAPAFAEKGTYVIDNSSAWRMESGYPLVVPEVNAHELTVDKKIIANPNCSTIQMVVALKPLYDKYGIKRLVISTYQSFTGTGKDAVDQYEAEKVDNQDPDLKVYPHQIFANCLPHCDVFYDNGYTKEELKLVNETRKIFNDNTIAITATAVRVPVFGGHSESVNAELKSDFELSELKELMGNFSGIVVQDDPKNNVYPMPLDAHNKDDVFVGRIRRDESIENGVNMWVVSDNLRKGAATNAVQIAEHLIQSVI